MFISVLKLFKIGVGPSSSHTMGPMVAARTFSLEVARWLAAQPADSGFSIRCTLRGSLAYTGKGHATDRAVLLGLHGYTPLDVSNQDVDALIDALRASGVVRIGGRRLGFASDLDIVFDRGAPLPEHPNGLVFEVLDQAGRPVFSETYFSVGGGFVCTRSELQGLVAPLRMSETESCPWGFDSAQTMLRMAEESGLSIAAMKRANELSTMSAETLEQGLDAIWDAMKRCLERGLAATGRLPGGLDIPRRARDLHRQLLERPGAATVNDWLCAYAMAVNEENAAGNMVVTAPTNGAAGVIPAVLYRLAHDEGGSREQIHTFLLTAAAIGGLIKHRSSISGAEVGCQGEVGSAAAMAAAGLCAAHGGNPGQVENAAEIALEHHLGMTCDPVRGLVQVPCIERNGFGAIKAYTAASLALRGTGQHFVPLDNCIAAMKQTGQEMSAKFKETSLGGLAVSITEC
jgi:L-serine dehydratase